MMQQIPDTEKDLEYKKAVRGFFLIYNSLKRKRALRWNGHSDMKCALIEVWEYTNNGEIKTICRVKAENSRDCYRMAAEQLRWEKQKEEIFMRETLRKARKEKGLTQQQVADQLRVGLRHYQKIEAGDTTGSFEIWDALEDILGIHQRILRETTDNRHVPKENQQEH